MRLWQRRAWGFRKTAISLQIDEDHYRVARRGTKGWGEFMFPGKRYEVPARDIFEMTGGITAELGDAAIVLGKTIEVELFVDAIGCPKFVKRIRLPRLTQFSKREEWESPSRRENY